MAYKVWLGAGALTIGVGAAALACSGVANADGGTGLSARHTVSASHSPSTAAHDAPRPKPTAALIAASTITGVANHKRSPAAAVANEHATTSSAPPATAHASAGTNFFTGLLGRIVLRGSEIQNFNVVRAVHDFSAVIHDVVQTVFINPVDTVIRGVSEIVATALFVVALPVEIPLALYFFNAVLHSGFMVLTLTPPLPGVVFSLPGPASRSPTAVADWDQSRRVGLFPTGPLNWSARINRSASDQRGYVPVGVALAAVLTVGSARSMLEMSRTPTPVRFS